MPLRYWVHTNAILSPLTVALGYCTLIFFRIIRTFTKRGKCWKHQCLHSRTNLIHILISSCCGRNDLLIAHSYLSTLLTVLITKGWNIKLSSSVTMLGMVGLVGESVLWVKNSGNVIAIVHRHEITGFLLLVNPAQRFSMGIFYLHWYDLTLHIHHLLVNSLVLILE